MSWNGFCFFVKKRVYCIVNNFCHIILSHRYINMQNHWISYFIMRSHNWWNYFKKFNFHSTNIDYNFHNNRTRIIRITGEISKSKQYLGIVVIIVIIITKHWVNLQLHSYRSSDNLYILTLDCILIGICIFEYLFYDFGEHIHLIIFVIVCSGVCNY